MRRRLILPAALSLCVVAPFVAPMTAHGNKWPKKTGSPISPGLSRTAGQISRRMASIVGQTRLTGDPAKVIGAVDRLLKHLLDLSTRLELTGRRLQERSNIPTKPMQDDRKWRAALEIGAQARHYQGGAKETLLLLNDLLTMRSVVETHLAKGVSSISFQRIRGEGDVEGPRPREHRRPALPDSKARGRVVAETGEIWSTESGAPGGPHMAYIEVESPYNSILGGYLTIRKPEPPDLIDGGFINPNEYRLLLHPGGLCFDYSGLSLSDDAGHSAYPTIGPVIVPPGLRLEFP